MNNNLQNSFSSRKKIFITGIAGFIGFHLALKLKERGDHVEGCDNFNPYYDPELKKSRAAILRNAGITVHNVDIRDKSTIEKIFHEGSFTHIAHLAAQAGVRYCITHPQAYVESNLDGFVQMLEIARQFGTIPFIYASSSSVYGLNKKIPFSEEDPTDHPSNFYGATKKSNELIARSYHNLYKIPVTGLRFFTVYGPWGRPDMAYFNFTKLISESKPIPLFAQGKMLRDFTFIDDIIQGTIAAIDKSYSNEIFNLGNNRPHSVLELVSTIENSLNIKAQFNHFPAQLGEVETTFADISKAKSLLSFQPDTSLENGIKKFTNWYKDFYK